MTGRLAGRAWARRAWLLIAIAGCRGFADHGVAPDAAEVAGEDAGAAALPRLIAPLSMSSVTQQRPTLRWVLGPGEGTPVVDLCADRACATSLPIAVELAADQRSAKPMAALPPGWVYWRVRSVAGDRTRTSATWQIWVGAASASTAVDTSHGAILDVNGDGYADVVTGSYDRDTIYLYLGSATASATGWNDPASALRIALVNPDGALAAFGLTVANAGDVNGDGFGDFLVGAPNAALDVGAAHVYLGSAAPSAEAWNGASPAARLDLASPDGDNTRYSAGLDGAGDVNGDGYADFVIGAYLATTSGGVAHVYLGGPVTSAAAWNGASPPGRIDLANPDGDSAEFGQAVAGVGDVDGDGFADVLIGASSAARGGAANLYLGGADPAGGWNGPATGRRIDLVEPSGRQGQFGWAVTSGGDVNGDGYADFVIAVPGQNAIHVYLGTATPSATSWSAASSADRVDVKGPANASPTFAYTVALAGDINRDGYMDLLAEGSSGGEGACLYLGGAAPVAAQWTGAGAPRRIELARPATAGTNFGEVTDTAGDINGDGYLDFVVGSLGDVVTPGSALGHVYLGGPLPSATAWNGASPAQRIELVIPADAP
ncbi:MAG: FG-GAP-like repeat-containing protein [Kofleriaceae bacterium]